MEQFGDVAGWKGLLGNKSFSSTSVVLSPKSCVTSTRMPALVVVVLFWEVVVEDLFVWWTPTKLSGLS